MDHAATMRRIYELISAGDIDGFGTLMGADFVEHEEAPGVVPTKEGVLDMFRMYVSAFPDMVMMPDDVLVDGDKAVARVTVTGTNEGPFMGMPATGRRVEVQVIDIMRFGHDGLVHEHWGLMDALGMMQQLGALPEDAPG
ncbi:MAG: ester cyclase [Dehalococcoidia bacterium]